MPAQWEIKHWPECGKHAFLSHCAEDRDLLVQPVFEELSRRGIVPWIDCHHYPAGRDAIETLQEELLKCRHVVYFITPAMLCQGRGWTSAERTLTAAVQRYLYLPHGLKAANLELPLVFVAATNAAFQRSLWRSLLDKAVRCPHPAARSAGGLDDGRRDWRDEHIVWAADEVEKFIRLEEKWAIELADVRGQDAKVLEEFEHEPNLMRRLLAQAPPTLPFP